MTLTSLDLNHVRALHHLLEEAHVGRAARRLGITPAAASNALLRLRRDFDDPLLVRAGRGFVRSARAEALRGPARAVMEAAARLVETAAPFDPSTDEGEFVLFASDRVAEVLARPLDAVLTAQAPRARLHLQHLGLSTHQVGEERGLYILPAIDHGLRAAPLFTEEYRCLMRAGHPLLDGPYTVERYAAAAHILVAPRGRSLRGPVDEALESLGLTRRISRVVSSFRLALSLVEGSDRVVTLPSSFVAGPGAHPAFVSRPPPLTLPSVSMQVAWHPRLEGDPRYDWFRARLVEAVDRAGLGPS